MEHYGILWSVISPPYHPLALYFITAEIWAECPAARAADGGRGDGQRGDGVNRRKICGMFGRSAG